MHWYNLHGTPIEGTPTEQLLAGGALMGDPTGQVAYDDVRVDGEHVSISTVFLALDHDFSTAEHVPVLYETLVRGGVHDGEVTRYTCRADAEEGHLMALALVRLLPR